MLDKRQQQILALRNHSMETRKVICTGNPNREGTIASGVKEIWPDATFIHLSKGYDFLNLGDKRKEIEQLLSDPIPQDDSERLQFINSFKELRKLL